MRVSLRFAVAFAAMACLASVPTRAQEAPAEPAAPPVVIAVQAPNLDAEDIARLTQFVQEGVTGRIERRGVQVAPEALATAVAECAEAACFGAALQTAEAAAGVFVRGERRGRRGPWVFEVASRAAGSGATLGDAQTVELSEFTAEAIAAALAAPIGAIGLPQPPPRPRLLVAVNADGATVSLDGNEIGQTPLAAFDTTVGRHTLAVQLLGYQPFSRSVEISAEGLRINVTLEPDLQVAERIAEEEEAALAAAEGQGEGVTDQWWFWPAVGGGAAIVVTAIIIGVAASGGSDEPAPGFELPAFPGGM